MLGIIGLGRTQSRSPGGLTVTLWHTASKEACCIAIDSLVLVPVDVNDFLPDHIGGQIPKAAKTRQVRQGVSKQLALEFRFRLLSLSNIIW